MRLVLDASVAVAAARPREPGHRRSCTRVDDVLSGTDGIVAIRSYVDALLAGAAVATLGPRAARRARETATRWRLRAADAVCVWLTERRGCRSALSTRRSSAGECATRAPSSARDEPTDPHGVLRQEAPSLGVTSACPRRLALKRAIAPLVRRPRDEASKRRPEPGDAAQLPEL
jgi:hypothetical protein